jgi:predicted subunit of tRNA(5-methylaminomethyl-2-thiouridylate) methyltransferase
MFNQKAYVLYSGGKDSSLVAILLKRMGFDVELLTANFGVYKSYTPASNSAKSLDINHSVLNLDKNILKKAVNRVLDDGFPNNGISYLHKSVIEELADLANEKNVSIIADGTRRDDRTPKLDKNEIRSLEDRKNLQYVNLDSFGYKTIETLVSNLFEITHEESNRDNSSDYEVEIRYLIDSEMNGNSTELFPKHYQTRVTGFKNCQIN